MQPVLCSDALMQTLNDGAQLGDLATTDAALLLHSFAQLPFLLFYAPP